jgi:D-serine dehydratase
VVGVEYEEKLINNTLVRVMKFPKYTEEEMEEARERLRKLGPYIEKVLRESSEE